MNKTAGSGAPRGSRLHMKHQGIVPATFTDRADYHRQYNREYNKRFKRVLVPGVKIRRCDLEILEAACKAKRRTLAADIVAVLEGMAKQARTAAVGKGKGKGAGDNG